MRITKHELETFQNIPIVIENYLQEIPEHHLDKRRSSTAWTIREHVYHIADVQEMLLSRIKKILSEPRPVIEPYFPEKDVAEGLKYHSITEALSEYKSLRKEQCDLISKASAQDFNKEAVHKEYHHYSLPIIITHMIFHDYWHMYRIEETWLTRDEYFSS